MTPDFIGKQLFARWQRTPCGNPAISSRPRGFTACCARTFVMPKKKQRPSSLCLASSSRGNSRTRNANEKQHGSVSITQNSGLRHTRLAMYSRPYQNEDVEVRLRAAPDRCHGLWRLGLTAPSKERKAFPVDLSRTSSAGAFARVAGKTCEGKRDRAVFSSVYLLMLAWLDFVLRPT